ncbi:unnamed protein product [Closterium sp. NIES-54]
MATITVLRQRQPSVHESLSPQQLREWAIWWGSPGGGASRACRRKPLSPHQRREWAVRRGSPSGGAWGATTGGTCKSTPAGSAAGRHGGSGGGQQQQQRSPETLSPQQLREWAVRWGSPGRGGFWSTRTGGIEAPGAVEAATLGAFDSPSTGAETEEALHTYTLDSGASRCFFRDSTIVTPLTVPVPITLADPSWGLVVARGATVLPYPAAPSGLLTGLCLPLFAKNLVATSVLQDQWVTVTQPEGELVAICTDSRTGEDFATFTRWPGSGLNTLTTESALVAESGQVAASVEVVASCLCRLLTHQTLLWHHGLGHPSLPRLPGMHSCLLVCGLPRSLAPLLRSLAPPCLPCVEGRQRTAPHSSFPPTTDPLQTLHMDVWGPARVIGQGGERYFLLDVDDYTRYTAVFPLQSKVDVRGVLIRWIRDVRLQLRARFREDLPVLRLHSDRGGELCSHLLEDFCGAEGIVQSYTLPASPQQNGIAERRIGLVMEVARTSMIHAAAPHFLWPFAVRYAAEQPNLWPRVSHPETSPTLRWTGEVGDASTFWVCGSLSLVRDLPMGELSPRTLQCVFLGFLTDAQPWQFYHPGSRRVLSSRNVTFDKSVCFYRLHPHRSSPVDPPPLVEPLEVSSDTSGPAEGGDQTATDTVAPRRSARLAVPPGFQPRPSSLPLRPVDVDSSAAGGGDTGGVDSRGAGSGGAASPTGAGGAGGAAAGSSAGGAGAGGTGAGGAGARSGGAGSRGASAGVPRVGRAGGTSVGGTGATGETGGAAAVGAAAGSPGSRRQEPLSPERLREWAVHWGSLGSGAGRTGAIGSGDASPGGASAGVPGVGRARGTGTGGTGAAGGTGGAGHVGASAIVPRVGGTGGADTGGATGGTGVGNASRQELLSPQQLREWAVRWGSPGGGAGGTSFGGAVATGARGSGGATTQPQQSALRHLLSLPPTTTEFPVAGTTPPLLFPTTIPSQPQLLPSSPLPALAPHTAVTESFTERREHASRPVTPVRSRRAVRPCPPSVPGTHIMALRPSSLPQRVVLPSPPASSLPHVPDPESDLVRTTSPTVTRLLAKVMTGPSFEGELALGCDVLEDRQFELECLPAAAPHLASTLLDIPTPHTYTDAITVYGLRQAPCEWHETLRTTLAALGFAPSTADPSLFLRTNTSLSPFYVVVYVDDLVFATADTEALALVKVGLQERYTCTDLGELQSYLGLQFTWDRARRTITLTQSHMVQQVLQPFDFSWSLPQPTPLSTGHSLSAPPSDKSVEPSGSYPELVVCLMYLMMCTRPDLAYPLSLLARYVAPDASWADDQATHWSTQGYSFSLGTGSVSWRSTHSSFVLSSSCKAEIYARAMAAQGLHWLTYLLTDLHERPHSPPVLFVDNKAMIALCQEQRLEHRTKHIALRYFLTRKLLQRGQLRLAYMATQANTADVFT